MKTTKKNRKVLISATLLVLSATVGAASAKETKVTDGLSVPVYTNVKGTYVFAHGFGLIYGPMPVAETLGVLEKMFPNAKIEWKTIFTTAQQRDAMLAGRLQYGSCTPGPFLQSWSKGVAWKWLQTTSGFDGYLMVQPNGPKSVFDFIGTNRKLSPGPNTAQYYTVQEILRKAGKDVHALDRNWVNLPHPAAVQALIGKQLDGAFETADYALRLQQRGMKEIASIKATYGSLYPVGVCALTKTVQEHPDVSKGYAEALRKVVDWMNAHPKKAAAALSKNAGGKETPAQFLSYLKSPVYASFSKNADLKAYAESMYALGSITKKPQNPSDLYFYPAEAGPKW